MQCGHHWRFLGSHDWVSERGAGRRPGWCYNSGVAWPSFVTHPRAGREAGAGLGVFLAIRPWPGRRAGEVAEVCTAERSSNAGGLQGCVSLDIDGGSASPATRRCPSAVHSDQAGSPRSWRSPVPSLVEDLSDLRARHMLAGHGFRPRRRTLRVRRPSSGCASRGLGRTTTTWRFNLGRRTTTSAPSARPDLSGTASTHRRRSTSAPGPSDVAPGG